jgi:hypothetical protein
MASHRQVVVIGFLCPLCVKVVVQVLFDDLWLPVRAGIVHDETDERKARLLHAKAIHGILDIECLVVSVAPHRHLKVTYSLNLCHYTIFFFSEYL